MVIIIEQIRIVSVLISIEILVIIGWVRTDHSSRWICELI